MSEVELQEVPVKPEEGQEQVDPRGQMPTTPAPPPETQVVAPPPNPPIVQGSSNPAFNQEETDVDVGPETPPPLTFVDFLPVLLEEAASAEDAPKYADFSTVLAQANQWLQGNPSYMAMKCETFAKRLGNDNSVDADCVIHHESSYGVNKYIRGLRLWLAPKMVDGEPPQELRYLTILPDSDEGTNENVMSLFTPLRFTSTQSGTPAFAGIADTMEKLNRFLKKKPIPGSVLNLESFDIKYEDANPVCNLDTEQMCWLESGRASRVFVTAIRLYYVMGKPAFEVVGLHDELPVCLNNFESFARIRFCPFTTVVQRAKKWLQMQKGIRVINMQTAVVFCDRSTSGEARIHSHKSGYCEEPRHDIQLARVLRIFYINNPKSTECPYGSVQLTSRLFIPTRQGGYGKNYETFSKTMQRVITWLRLTKAPIFGVETVQYPFSPDSWGSGVQGDLALLSRNANHGKYHITTVRIYFPCEYNEPAADVMPAIQEEESWWQCTVS